MWVPHWIFVCWRHSFSEDTVSVRNLHCFIRLPPPYILYGGKLFCKLFRFQLFFPPIPNSVRNPVRSRGFIYSLWFVWQEFFWNVLKSLSLRKKSSGLETTCKNNFITPRSNRVSHLKCMVGQPNIIINAGCALLVKLAQSLFSLIIFRD